jgi:Sugar kinases, ribokinase family
MKQILCLGDACADIVIPYGDAKKGIDSSVEFTCGGATANTASGLGRLGVPCLFLGKAGDDYFGHVMKRSLEQDGVETKFFILDKNLSSVLVMAVLDENNDRFTFLMPRENPSHLELYDADMPENIWERISIVHTTGLMLFEQPAAGTVCRFLEECSRHGVKISVDINFRIETATLNREYLSRAMKTADFLLGSGVEEFVPLTGIDDPLAAARSLVTNKRTVICRMGKKGSIVFRRDAEYYAGAYAVEVADTLGAGDAFNSGFLWAIEKGLTLQEANQAGCAAAALNLTKRGARNCPTERELRVFMSQSKPIEWGIR